MRILHIIPRLNQGGAERLVLDICNELQKSPDVQVRLLTFSEENAYPYLTESLDWKVVPASVHLSVWRKNELHITALQQAIEDFQPDIIHTHLFEAEIVSRSCYYPKARWFSHCHDNMKQFRNLTLSTLLHKELLTNAYEKHYLYQRYNANGGNTFIAISNDNAAYFRKVASPFRVELLLNAINYKRFFCLRKPSEHTCLRLVNTGSYTDNKNQQFLIQVAKYLKEMQVDFMLTLLGDGKNYANIAQQIKQYGLGQHVVQKGNVNNVEDYLSQADIYVHAALSEQFGLVLLEAMAAGLPVVTLDGKGNRDIIEEGKNGFMLYEENAEAFANKILEVWNNKELYASMSGFAQQFAKNYDIESYVNKLLKLYKKS